MAETPEPDQKAPAFSIPGTLKVTLQEIEDRPTEPISGDPGFSLVGISLGLEGITEEQINTLAIPSVNSLRSLLPYFTNSADKQQFEVILDQSESNQLLEFSQSTRSFKFRTIVKNLTRTLPTRPQKFIACKLKIILGNDKPLASKLLIDAEDLEKATTSKLGIALQKDLDLTTKLRIST